MSQDSAVNIVLPLEQVKVKKPRAPSLQAKDAKIIQAIFWYLKSQKSEPDEGLSDEEFTSIQLFASVEQQKAFTDTFFDASKDIAKEIRLLQNDKKKALVKAAKQALKAATTLAKANGEDVPKQKRPRNSKATTNDSTTESTHEPSADSKKKKNFKKIQNTQDSLINELVTLARTSSASEPPPPPPPALEFFSEPPTCQATPTQSNEKAVKEPKENTVKESKEKTVKEPKKKTVKEPKEKTVKVAPTIEPTINDDVHDDVHDDDDDALDVSPFEFNGQHFLIADDSSLFLPTTQALIGHFNKHTNSIIFV